MSFDDKIVHEKLGAESSDDLERKASLQEGETLAVLGYKEELTRNRSLWTLLFQSLAIAAVPYGEGSPLISAIYGGGQLSMFLGWIVVLLLDECIALSLGELASRYPTSGGPSYWSFRMFLHVGQRRSCLLTRWTELAQKGKVPLAYITGKSEGSNVLTCGIPADTDLNNNRLDLAHRQLDNHSFSKLWNGFADRRVSDFDIPSRSMSAMLASLPLASHQ